MDPRKNPYPDIINAYSTIVALGFKPMILPLYRADARGAEYGMFRVNISDTDNIKVTRENGDGREEYSMSFQDTFATDEPSRLVRSAIENFKQWVRATL